MCVCAVMQGRMRPRPMLCACDVMELWTSPITICCGGVWSRFGRWDLRRDPVVRGRTSSRNGGFSGCFRKHGGGMSQFLSRPSSRPGNISLPPVERGRVTIVLLTLWPHEI